MLRCRSACSFTFSLSVVVSASAKLHSHLCVFHSFVLLRFRFLKIAELKAKRDQNLEQEKQRKNRIEHLEKTVKHQQQELKKRTAQVSEFERVRTTIIQAVSPLLGHMTWNT